MSESLLALAKDLELDLELPRETRVATIKALRRVGELPCLIVRTLEQANSLLPKIKRILDEELHRLEPFHKKNYSWYETLKDVDKRTRNFTRGVILGDRRVATGRSIVCNNAWGVVYYKFYGSKFYNGESYFSTLRKLGFKRKGIKHLASNIAMDAHYYVGLEYSSYLPNFSKYFPNYRGNPFECNIEIYELGMIPLGPRHFKEREKLLIDIPLKANRRTIMGLYQHGDLEIKMFHYLYEHFKRSKPISEI